MKHKKFNELYPYGYFLIRKSDGMKYVGIRYANVKHNLTPEEDFGRVYFTSGTLEKEFKENPDDFWFKVKYTFDTIDELFKWEKKIALRIYRRPDWANNGWGQNYGENPEIGRLISEGKRKRKSCGRTSIEIGAEKLRDWVWNTAEGEQWRKDISERISTMRKSWSEEKEREVQEKRKARMDFKAARAKAQITFDTVREDGTTLQQEMTAKARETCMREGIYERQGKAFSDWCRNTPEGREYVERARGTSKRLMDELDPEVLAQRIAKKRATVAQHTEQQKKEIVRKFKETYNETLKKLSEMSEEEFELHCKGFTERGKKILQGRILKYLQRIGGE